MSLFRFLDSSYKTNVSAIKSTVSDCIDCNSDCNDSDSDCIDCEELEGIRAWVVNATRLELLAKNKDSGSSGEASADSGFAV